MAALSSPGDPLALENFEPLMQKLAILRLFDYPKAEEYVIPVDAETPGWDVCNKIRGLISQARPMIGRTIILIHYSGHGINWNERLHFCNATGKKHFHVAKNMLDVVDSESDVTDSDDIDVVFIFDSCYSYLVTREYTGLNRIVEILAAVDEDSTGLRVSFTEKLYAEILRRKRLGAKGVELAELIAYLRKESPVTKPKPAYRILVGVNSLRLSIPGSTEGGPIYQPPGPAIHAVFSFRLAKSLSINQLAAFRDWIWKLPREIGLTLDAVYETQSMTLIFQASCAF